MKIRKEITISAAHKIPNHEKCGQIHGHNYRIIVECRSDVLENGMVVDFGDVSHVVKKLDHVCLNDLMETPTAENMALYLGTRIPFCTSVTVWETDTSCAIWEK